MRKCVLMLVTSMVALAQPVAVSASPFLFYVDRDLPCLEHSLVAYSKYADMIIVGKFGIPPKSGAGKAGIDFQIIEVLKAHPLLKGKDKLRLRDVQWSDKIVVLYLDVFNEDLVVYRRVGVAKGSPVLDYVKG